MALETTFSTPSRFDLPGPVFLTGEPDGTLSGVSSYAFRPPNGTNDGTLVAVLVGVP